MSDNRRRVNTEPGRHVLTRREMLAAGGASLNSPHSLSGRPAREGGAAARGD